MLKKTTKMEMFFDLPNPGLRAYLQHVIDGQPDEYRTPFYKGKSTSAIVSSWMDKLKSIEDSHPELYAYETDMAAKVGPLSIMKPLCEREDDIQSYYESIRQDSTPICDEALNLALHEWKAAAGLRRSSQENTVRQMKLSTNSGNPYFTTRNRVLGKTIPCKVTREYTEYPQGTFHNVAILGWRGQEGGPEVDDVKQRVVWMFPFGINVEELSVYQPLIKSFQRLNLVPAWVSGTAVDVEVTRLMDTKSKDDVIVCTDFTKFDQHFNERLQSVAHQCLRRLFSNNPSMEDWFENVFPIKYEIPLLKSWNNIQYGRHGMGSGSGGTNVDETLTHRVLQHEAAFKSHAILNPHSQCLGDDGILSYKGITVDDVMLTYTQHGLEMNKSKQYVSTHDCIYLRRWYHIDYRFDGICAGVYPTCRALGRLAEQERFYDNWSAEMVILRYLSILENIKFHPLRETFVDFCMEGDKFRLGLSLPHFFDKLTQLAKEATEYMPDFLGYTRSISNSDPSRGIADWWVVKYLKSKA